MKRVFIASFLIILLFSSCTSSKELVSDLVLKNDRYYKKKSEQPFTGIAITKFDNGVMSSSTELKNGVPNGKWFAYGYKSEIVQEGKYIPVVTNEPLFVEKNIKRLNVSFGKEGSYSFTDVYVIVENTLVSDIANLKKDIQQLLQRRNILVNKDSLNEIKIVKGELE